MIVVLYAYFYYYHDVESKGEKVRNKCMKTKIMFAMCTVHIGMSMLRSFFEHKEQELKNLSFLYYRIQIFLSTVAFVFNPPKSKTNRNVSLRY